VVDTKRLQQVTYTVSTKGSRTSTTDRLIFALPGRLSSAPASSDSGRGWRETSAGVSEHKPIWLSRLPHILRRFTEFVYPSRRTARNGTRR
jgi:hypothetical protein